MTIVNLKHYELQRAANAIAMQLSGTPCTRSHAARLSDLVDAIDDLEASSTPTAEAVEPAKLPDENGAMMGATTTRLDVAVTLRMRQIPSGMVHLLDPGVMPLITCKIDNFRRKTARLKITSRVEGFSADAIDTFELPARSRCERSQLPIFLLDRLATVTEMRAASLYVRVDDLDGKVEHEQTYRVVLLPRSTAYLQLRDTAGATVDLSRYFGAWVTPNAPEIMQLVRDAAERNKTGKLVGYQAEREEDMPAVVEAQVAAIYHTLKARELTYVNSVIAFNLAGDMFVQRIRLPRESLANRSANCIDGVVLMASALEAISLNPAIVIVPGHALLAYERRAFSGQWDFVETTMLGSKEFVEAQVAGRELAALFQGKKSSRMQILSIAKLRIDHAIFPME